VRLLRHTDEWVGLLVVAALLLFLGAVLEAGVLRDWFRPVASLRILLPQEGVGGLAVGADIEVLGIHAGSIRRIVLSPNQQIYATADVDQQAQAFIRRDSQAVIRRRFGVVGAAYVDISRGAGAPLDWSYAVIGATTERAPTDTISGIIDELRERILPVLDDTRRTMDAVAVVAESLRQGHGTLGRLLTDDTLSRHAEQTLQTVQEQVAALAPVIAKLDDAAKQANALLDAAASGQEGVPSLIRRTDEMLQSLQAIADDLRQGRGTLGRLLTEDSLARDAEQTVNTLQEQIKALAPLIAKLDDAAKQADALLAAAASGKEGVPSLIRRVDAVLQTLQSALRDISRATPYLPEISRNVAGGTASLPALMTQTQLAAAELERLLKQLQGSWLLGGSGGGPPPATRLPAGRLQP
jgi:phospholipid/cholesterol/gamma-HCH transport system substrate-binding protein